MKNALLAVGGVALAVTISACGAETVSGQASPSGSATLFGNAQELVRAASTKTGQEKTAKFTLTESVGQQQITGHGEGRYDGPNTALDMNMAVLGQDMEVRFVDKTVYIKLPAAATAQLSGGKPWGRVAAGNPMAQALGATTQQAQQNDPSKILDQIQQAGTITRSEQTTLDGQPTSHYWVDIDFAKAAASFGANAGLPADQLQKLAGQIKTIPVQLWLNSDSLPVQITEDLTAISQAAGAPASAQPVNLTLRYSDWGTPVDVQAPPADQVGDLQAPN
jgi:hypothetical protein